MCVIYHYPKFRQYQSISISLCQLAQPSHLGALPTVLIRICSESRLQEQGQRQLGKSANRMHALTSRVVIAAIKGLYSRLRHIKGRQQKISARLLLDYKGGSSAKCSISDASW